MAAADTTHNNAGSGPGGGPGGDPAALALRALVWTLAAARLAMRLLDVTGLDPRDLKSRINDPAVLAATLAFLEGNEADLLACAAQLGCPPAALVAAHAALEGEGA